MDFEQYFCTFNKWSSILFNQPVSDVSLLRRYHMKTRLHAILTCFASPQLIPFTHPHISLVFVVFLNENVRQIMSFCAVNWTDRREGRDSSVFWIDKWLCERLTAVFSIWVTRKNKGSDTKTLQYIILEVCYHQPSVFLRPPCFSVI